MRLAGFVTITRPVNSFVAGLAAIIAYLIDTGTVIPESLLLFFIVALITAAGNVINDFFDAEIDAINRPDRPIPSGAVSRGAARGFAVTLFLAGILVSFFTNPLCVGIAIFNTILLIAYAAKLKSTPLIGNIVVAYLAASIFLFGGALNGVEGIIRIIPVAAITFFAMVSRELLKDAEDVEGDRTGGADTVPLRIGIKKTSEFALITTVLAVMVSFLPYFWWGAWYLGGIIAVDIIIIIAALRGLNCETPACVKASKATSLLKVGMFASLVVFTLSAVFLSVR
ncbi:MAG: geranylgeranylglycerol-phosphate geranylgeranyltransferase [Methanoregula sp.]|jgi:geranylgeranylglycerol-phosphate geranylgeranyltransferase|nr:geranylgeranylglycerol-phosphate geranylgeranyltransferase [Methanoregula sp.]